MVPLTMVNIIDIRDTLKAQIARQQSFPGHIKAFISWLSSDNEQLRKQINEVFSLQRQAWTPEHVATLGYGATSRLLSEKELSEFCDEIIHLKGRRFFVPGRPPRFEIDGTALLGVALGIATYDDPETQKWLNKLLNQSSQKMADDDWQLGLIDAARLCTGESNIKIIPADLSVALASKGLTKPDEHELNEGWALVSNLQVHHFDPVRSAVCLTAFKYVLARNSQITTSSMTQQSLVELLQGISRSMRLWTYENERRTPKSEIARWEVENEYHVQNLLWTVLAPIFPDLKNEESFPSIGHKHPRADLCIPSLRTIIEVKFMRSSGQSACTKVIDEIASDASLYLSNTTTYDNIICFVWDDCSQTEQYDLLKSGLENIKGVSSAIILPRPSKMKKLTD